MKMTVNQLASNLKTTPRTVRRHLRSINRWDDKKYTRYELGKNDVDQVRKLVLVRGEVQRAVPRMAKKKAKKAA